MKKTIRSIACLVLCLALLFAFTACVDIKGILGLEPSTTEPTPTNSTSIPEGEDIVFKPIGCDTEITIPAYSGEYYIAVNDYEPFFTESDLVTESYEKFSDLDELGRCGVAMANVGSDLMPPPEEERESLTSVSPTGWTGNNNKYDFVSASYIYNRAHLIGYQLTGENANKLNLITGTRAFNVDAMLVFENMVADYVKETNNHVLLRVTPVYFGDNLVAHGVLMEAKSVEDDGEGVLYNVFCYNSQEGVTIDYKTGQNYANGETPEIVDYSIPPENVEEVIAQIDTNGNGKITIAEAEAGGFKMPIVKPHWLYEYMTDSDGDGTIG